MIKSVSVVNSIADEQGRWINPSRKRKRGQINKRRKARHTHRRWHSLRTSKSSLLSISHYTTVTYADSYRAHKTSDTRRFNLSSPSFMSIQIFSAPRDRKVYAARRIKNFSGEKSRMAKRYGLFRRWMNCNCWFIYGTARRNKMSKVQRDTAVQGWGWA